MCAQSKRDFAKRSFSQYKKEMKQRTSLAVIEDDIFENDYDEDEDHASV
jgi:hypothetical protein